MLNVLEKHGLCNVVRPTGFGKTKMFMDLVHRFSDESFVYVYDMNSVVEDVMNKYHPENVEFVSYTRISMSGNKQDVMHEICGKKRKAIIFDESHLMGGDNISKFLEDFLPLAKSSGVWILGGTATPLRMDLIDVTQKFFEGHEVFQYTLEDAISDGLIISPHWVVTVHVQQLLKQLRAQVSSNGYQIERIRQLDRAYTKILDVSKVYRDGVLQTYGDVPDRMEFIAFYPTIESMLDGKEQLVSDFSQAFPKHSIHAYMISSDSTHYSDIVSLKSKAAEVEGKTVSLIMSVNMLNQAYHSDDLTGLVMNRATESNRIFTQQLGRGLSVTATHKIVVFDNVGNAKISPDAFILNMEALEKISDGKYGQVKDVRKHRSFTVNAQPEVLELLEWYQRIKATSTLTQEQVDYARYVLDELQAPPVIVAKGLGIRQEDVEAVVRGV